MLSFHCGLKFNIGNKKSSRELWTAILIKAIDF